MKPAIDAVPLNRFQKLIKHPIKLTALLYLQEALLAERFEDCTEFIAIAREFGAETFEIEYLIEDPRRQPKG